MRGIFPATHFKKKTGGGLEMTSNGKRVVGGSWSYLTKAGDKRRNIGGRRGGRSVATGNQVSPGSLEDRSNLGEGERRPRLAVLIFKRIL